MVIGRIAVWAWITDEGKHQFTKDLDIAVSKGNVDLIRQWLNSQRLDYKEISIGGIKIRYPESGINVDFIDRSDQFYGDLTLLFTEAINVSCKNDIRINIGDVKLLLVIPEYLVVMKLATGERDDEKDVENLLLSTDPDIELIRQLIMRHLGVGSLGKFEIILRDIGHPFLRKYER